MLNSALKHKQKQNNKNLSMSLNHLKAERNDGTNYMFPLTQGPFLLTLNTWIMGA